MRKAVVSIVLITVLLQLRTAGCSKCTLERDSKFNIIVLSSEFICWYTL